MDIKVNCIEKGEGMPLFLLHGNGEECLYFRNQIDVFSKFRRVIAVDTRGHGGTERGSKPFTISQFADDLFDLMTEKGIRKADILGFSDGGNIALTFALKHPERVSSLILDGANLDPAGVKRKIQIPIEIGYRIAGIMKNSSPEAMRKYELLGLMVNEPHITEDELRRLDMPVLVVAGTHDMIKESHTRKIAGSISGAELRFVEGDHFIAQKNPVEFNAVVSEFLMRMD